jgi:ketosteroid isomerase-like protein
MSDSVTAAFEAFVAAFNSGEPSRFSGAIAEDESSFVAGTQRVAGGRTEWLGNYQALVERGLVGPGGAGLRVEASVTHAFDEGAAGWVFGWVTFVFPDGSQLPTRVTAVFRRESNGWKLRHAHFSVAVPDGVATVEADGWLQQLGERPQRT